MGQILEECNIKPDDIRNSRTRSIFTSQLATWEGMSGNQYISMKEIDPKIRDYFSPFTIVGEVPFPNEAKIVVVDDLKSSGASIRSVAEILRQNGAVVDTGVCFLSGL